MLLYVLSQGIGCQTAAPEGRRTEEAAVEEVRSTYTADTDSGADTGDDTAAPVDSGPVDPGAALYTADCASCHGEDGKLGVGGAKDLTVKIPAMTDAAIATVVRNGKETMPGFALTDAEMTDLLAHLRATFGG